MGENSHIKFAGQLIYFQGNSITNSNPKEIRPKISGLSYQKKGFGGEEKKQNITFNRCNTTAQKTYSLENNSDSIAQLKERHNQNTKE